MKTLEVVPQAEIQLGETTHRFQAFCSRESGWLCHDD